LGGGFIFYVFNAISDTKTTNAYLLADLCVAQALLVQLHDLSLSVGSTKIK
jgi:hypothetical protein